MSESPRDELAHQLESYPDPARPYLQGGFSAAAKLSEQALKSVLGKLLTTFEGGRRRIGGSDLGPNDEIGEREAEQIASVFSLMMGLLSEYQVSPTEFVDTAKGKIFLAQNENTALLIANLICSQREEVETQISRARLAGSVLPSLRAFDITIDIRVEVADGAIKMAVPVAIIHIDTDTIASETWLQMSRADLEDTSKKLLDAIEDMKIAESFIPKR